MSIQLSDEPTLALSALQDTIRVLKCNKQSRVYFDSLNEQLSELLPQLAGSLESMKDEAAYGQTLKQSQLKGLQVRHPGSHDAHVASHFHFVREYTTSNICN